MSDSVQPHRWQPARVLRPQDSPGKNTGVVCHFLLQIMYVCVCVYIYIYMYVCVCVCVFVVFTGGSIGKDSAYNSRDTGDAGLIPGLGNSLEEEVASHSNILT